MKYLKKKNLRNSLCLTCMWMNLGLGEHNFLTRRVLLSIHFQILIQYALPANKTPPLYIMANQTRMANFSRTIRQYCNHYWSVNSKCSPNVMNISSTALPNIVRPSSSLQPERKYTKTAGSFAFIWMSWAAPSALRYLDTRTGSSFITPGQAFKTTTL